MVVVVVVVVVVGDYKWWGSRNGWTDTRTVLVTSMDWTWMTQQASQLIGLHVIIVRDFC